MAKNHWDAADDTLRRIIDIEQKLKAAVGIRDRAVVAANDTFAGIERPLRRELEQLEEKLEVQFLEGWPELKAEGVKMKKLTHGVLGRRKTSALKTLKSWTWPKVTDAIQATFKGTPDLLLKLVQVKVSPDKESIRRTLSSEQLSTVGLKVAEVDKFYYETNPQAVE
jgi:hypothetical protein